MRTDFPSHSFSPPLSRSVAAWMLSLLLLPGVLVNCSKHEATSCPPALPTTNLTLGRNSISVECAVSKQEQARGLMHRRSMDENSGMLFIFNRPHQAVFWMKNTLIPLSIAYINQDGIIMEIYAMTPLDTRPIPSRSYLVSYALEMNQGWFARHDLHPGDRVEGLPAPAQIGTP